MKIGKEVDGTILVKHWRDWFPNVSFSNGVPSDDFIASRGYKKVSLYKDHDSSTQKLVSADLYIEGNFIYAVEVQDKTSSDLQAETDALASTKREQRNQALYSTDWTQLPDSPYSGNVTWTNYRQALRDITVDPDWPNVDFPTEPQK